MAFVADEFTGRSLGSYQLLARLAVGGMAEIFLATATEGPFVGKPVVLKRILPDHREDPASLQMLIDEAKVTATLSHRHIAQVLDLVRDDDEVLLVIEFIRGATLEELVDHAAQRKEQLPLGLVLATVRDVAMALHHAHSHKNQKGQPQPIIHRDVTPKNVMIDFDGISKVLDFGIARAAGASRRTVAGMVRGTSAYMSPEQATDGTVDTRSDLFSLGIIFHELLVGQRLFQRGNPSQEMAAVYEAPIPAPSSVNRRVPKALDQVVMKALERHADRRYQSALDLLRDLGLAAASTTWSDERCAEFVGSRFAQRRDAIAKLLKEQGVTASAGITTAPARVAFPELELTGDAEPRTVVEHRPQVDTGTQPATPTVTAPSSPGPSETMTGSTPSAALASPEPPTSRGAPFRTAPLVAGARPWLRTASLGVGAAIALVVGALIGVTAYRAIVEPPIEKAATTAAPSAAPGVGRLTLQTDRPAEVRLGSKVIGHTPLVDLYVPSGKHALALREADGPWRSLEVTVAADEVSRVEVRLNELPVAP